MKSGTFACWVFGALAVVILVPALVTRPATAAQLGVSAAPLQAWTITHGFPALTEPTLALESDSLGPSGTTELDSPGAPAEPAPTDPAGPSDSPESPGTPGSPEGPNPSGSPNPPDVDLTDCGELSAYDVVVYGTRGDDALFGDDRREVLVGLGGDDTISGGDKGDCLLGGRGDDQLLGEDGPDVLIGGRGTDELDAGGQSGDICVDAMAPDVVLSCGADDSTEPTDPSTGTGQDPGGDADDEGAGSGGGTVADNSGPTNEPGRAEPDAGGSGGPAQADPPSQAQPGEPEPTQPVEDIVEALPVGG